MDETRKRLNPLAGRYRIEREIGRGGMAIVYLAHDLKQDRPVAVKVLRSEVAAALGPERFLREIEIASRLNHPHILPLYDSGHADGLLYYVMPVVEGQSLRDRLSREHELPLEDALQITREVVSALSYAHQHDLVHRDIKPENILLSGGVALVADFGIARAVTAAADDQLTSTGMNIGTPAYMSPEQGHGETVDGRTDQYSLGCVVYEMLAGAPPFTGPNPQAILARHTLDAVPPIRTIRSAVPQPVEQAVVRALAKRPSDRFPSVDAFQEALSRPVPRRALRTRVWGAALYATAAVAVLAAAYALWSPGRSAESRAVAVLRFDNIGGDPANEYFSDGMSEELTNALAKVPGLNVTARTSAFSLTGKGLDVREIGRRLRVGSVVEASVQRAGTRLRVRAQLIDAAKGYQLWSDVYERDAKDVFAVQDEIVRAIVGALQVKLTGAASAALAKPSTGSPEAHDLYLQGRYFFAKRDSASLGKAQEYFERAIAKDSSYALAYAGLSDAFTHQTIFGFVAPREVLAKGKAAVLRALALDSTLVEAHTSLAFMALVRERDWATAKREFDRALALNPRYPPLHLYYAWYFLAIGRTNSAVDELRTAVMLDPFDLIANTRLASMLFYARRYDEELAQIRRVREMDSTFFQLPAELARAYVQLGRCDEALAALKQGPAVSTRLALLQGVPGWAYARCGHPAEATAQLDRFRSDAQEGRYVAHYPLATIYTGLGDNDRAFAQLDSTYADRTENVFVIAVDPVFDAIRADPRFVRLLSKARPVF